MTGRAINRFLITAIVCAFSFVGSAMAAVQGGLPGEPRQTMRTAPLPLVSSQRQVLERLACRNCNYGGRRRGGGGAAVAVGLGVLAIGAIAAS